MPEPAEDSDRLAFGTMLASLMKSRPAKTDGSRWTDGMLAKRVHTTTATVANWRRGRSFPTANNLRELLAAFRLDRDDEEHREIIIDFEDALAQSRSTQSSVRTAKFFFYGSPFPSVTHRAVPRSGVDSWLRANIFEYAKGLCAIIANGGSGKTTSLSLWLDRNAPGLRSRFSRVFVWSFYRQGQTREFVDVDMFFDALRNFLELKTAATDNTRAKATACLDALSKKPTLLVIDGLEALQIPPGVEQAKTGRFKSDDAQEFFESLALMDKSSAILTSRVPIAFAVRDVADKVAQYRLGNLSAPEGLALLRSYGIDGSDDELSRYVTGSRGHALTLGLVGTFIQRAYRGRLPGLEEISLNASGEMPESARAERVLTSYLNWLPPGETALLSLCGFFDQPVSSEFMWRLATALLAEDSHRFDLLQNYRMFQFHLETLKSTDLIYDDEADPDVVDMHPMIKEYLGNVLRKSFPSTWSSGNRALYELLQDTAAPDWMLRRIVFGCRADLAQRAFDEIYLPSFSRYAGTFADLSGVTDGQILYALSAFFDHATASGIINTLSRDAQQALLLDAISIVTALRGYADPQLPDLFDRASLLAGDDDMVSWRIRYAQCRFHRMAGNLKGSKSDFEVILEAGQRRDDRSLLVGAYRNASAYYFYVADFQKSKQFAVKGEDVGYGQAWRKDKLGFVNNPLVMLPGYAALSSAMLEQRDDCARAVDRMHLSVSGKTDPHSRAIAAFIDAILADLGFGEAKTRDAAIKFERLAAEGELVQWLIAANILRASAEKASADTFSRYIRRWTDTGAKLFIPYWCALAGEASAHREDFDAIQSFSARGLAAARSTGETWANPRLERLSHMRAPRQE